MRAIFLALMILSVTAWAGISRKLVSSVGGPIPTSYATHSQSLLSSSAQSNSNVWIKNTTATDVACVLAASSTVAPATPVASESLEILVPASSEVYERNRKTSPAVYCRSLGSAITSGNLYFSAW